MSLNCKKMIAKKCLFATLSGSLKFLYDSRYLDFSYYPHRSHTSPGT